MNRGAVQAVIGTLLFVAGAAAGYWLRPWLSTDAESASVLRAATSLDMREAIGRREVDADPTAVNPPIDQRTAGDVAATFAPVDLSLLLESASQSDLFATEALRRRWVAQLRALQLDGRDLELVELLEPYVQHFPRDAESQQLLAEALMSRGQFEEALVPWHRVVFDAEDPAVVRNARESIALAVQNRVAHYEQRGGATAVLMFLARLSQLDPYDEHYAYLTAEWTARAGQLAAAEKLLETVRDDGIGASDKKARLREWISLRRSGVPLTRAGSHLVVGASAEPDGDRVPLVVDTGAEITLLPRSLVLAWGGRREAAPGLRVRGVTNGQPLKVQRYRIPVLRLGELTLRDVEVGAVEGELPMRGIVGLLGVDVLRANGLSIDTAQQLLSVSSAVLDSGPR